METVWKGKENWFELAGGSSYGGFELLGVDCNNNNNKMAMLVLELK